jgi:uncharacterized membrane protein YphA (DoxX/SURF4 family)
MSFSQYAGIAIVPTLARLVLAGAFISAGWAKFSDTEFSAEQATKLQELGVTIIPVAPATVTPATYRQAGDTTQPAAASTAPAPPSATQIAAPQSSVGGPLPPGKYTAKSLHFVTLMVDSQQWPYPTWMAYAAALTELVGGVLIFLGLFARLWGFALSCVMGVAFYLTTLPVLAGKGFFNLSPMEPSTMFVQLSLFVLAFGVLLTGAGPLSLDRLLFGGRREEELPPSKEPIRLPG